MSKFKVECEHCRWEGILQEVAYTERCPVCDTPFYWMGTESEWNKTEPDLQVDRDFCVSVGADGRFKYQDLDG